MSPILSWLLFGLLASVVAKVILPGPENMGWIRTIFVGVAGSFVGGYLATYLGIGASEMGWNLPAFLTAVGGSLILLVLNRLVARS